MNITLSKYIDELLFKYDCVIIPGFGGFVGNYSSARINPVKHKFYPPGKNITFNKYLVNNDGLLANLIAQHNGCSFEEAMTSISFEIQKIQRQLRDGSQVKFDPIGNFHQDIDGNLIFNSSSESNYLLDSYGLSVFQALPMDSISGAESNGAKVISINRKIDVSKYAKIAAAASIFFAALWIPLKTDIIENAGIDRYFKQLINSPAPTYQPKKASDFIFNSEMKSGFSLDENSSNTISFLDDHERYPETPDHIKVYEEKVEKKEDLEYTSIGKYQIVGGCFGVESNAKRFAKRLRRKGYSASITGKRNNLFVVAYGTFHDHNDAIEYLDSIKRTENPQAWLLTK